MQMEVRELENVTAAFIHGDSFSGTRKSLGSPSKPRDGGDECKSQEGMSREAGDMPLRRQSEVALDESLLPSESRAGGGGATARWDLFESPLAAAGQQELALLPVRQEQRTNWIGALRPVRISFVCSSHYSTTACTIWVPAACCCRYMDAALDRSTLSDMLS